MRSHPSFYSRINSLLKSRLSKKKEISHAAFYHRYLPAQTRSFDFFRQDERGRAKRLEKVHGGYGVWRAGHRELHPDALKENIRKKNTVEQPARKLTEDMPPQIKDNYLSFTWNPADTTRPVFADDTDIIKPYANAFENIGMVRDGSSVNGAIVQGCHVTKITALSPEYQTTSQSVLTHPFNPG